MKVKEILYSISKRLQEFEVPDSDLEAEILVRHTLKLDRETIFQEFEKDLLKSEEQSIYSLLDYVLVSVGYQINHGDIIGTVGSTGRSTGPHLDFRVNWFQTRLDPMSVLN